MKHMKNRWLLENGQINSYCESCLTYSNTNLTMLYHIKNIIEIFQIFRFFRFSCLIKIINRTINNINHSKIIDNRLVLILSEKSAF